MGPFSLELESILYCLHIRSIGLHDAYLYTKLKIPPKLRKLVLDS